jgi:cytochrome c oxidase assembly factor CtaG
MLQIAHAGHTLVTVSYFVPVVAFLVWLAVVQIRDRRDGGDRDRPS